MPTTGTPVSLRITSAALSQSSKKSLTLPPRRLIERITRDFHTPLGVWSPSGRRMTALSKTLCFFSHSHVRSSAHMLRPEMAIPGSAPGPYAISRSRATDPSIGRSSLHSIE